MKESKIEDQLKNFVENKAGICLKLWPVSLSGIPDRIVLLPGGRIWFVELKAPGKTPKRHQKYWHRVLSKLGFKVRVIASVFELDNFRNEVIFNL